MWLCKQAHMSAMWKSAAAQRVRVHLYVCLFRKAYQKESTRNKTEHTQKKKTKKNQSVLCVPLAPE